jgi:hypothetical protein
VVELEHDDAKRVCFLGVVALVEYEQVDLDLKRVKFKLVLGGCIVSIRTTYPIHGKETMGQQIQKDLCRHDDLEVQKII